MLKNRAFFLILLLAGQVVFSETARHSTDFRTEPLRLLHPNYAAQALAPITFGSGWPGDEAARIQHRGVPYAQMWRAKQSASGLAWILWAGALGSILWSGSEYGGLAFAAVLPLSYQAAWDRVGRPTVSAGAGFSIHSPHQAADISGDDFELRGSVHRYFNAQVLVEIRTLNGMGVRHVESGEAVVDFKAGDWSYKSRVRRQAGERVFVKVYYNWKVYWGRDPVSQTNLSLRVAGPRQEGATLQLVRGARSSATAFGWVISLIGIAGLTGSAESVLHAAILVPLRLFVHSPGSSPRRSWIAQSA